MSTETDYTDPRAKVSHPLAEGQVYTDARTGDRYELLLLTEHRATLREIREDDERPEYYPQTRTEFERNVGAGRFALDESTEGAASGCLATVEDLRDHYAEQDGRKASHKASALEEAIEQIRHGGNPDDNEEIDLESISGIGAKTAQALRAEGFALKKDVRRADREDLIGVSGMGEKNTDALLEAVGT